MAGVMREEDPGNTSPVELGDAGPEELNMLLPLGMLLSLGLPELEP